MKKTHQHNLRLTDHQERLLQRYRYYRGFRTEMDAVRAMIDGLEAWFQRTLGQPEFAQHDEVASHQSNPEAGASHQSKTLVEDHSGLPSAIDVEEPDGDTSVGDFAGRPSIALPESRAFDDD